MLVLDPSRRYTIEQIKQHRWMMIEVMEPITVMSENQSNLGTLTVEPNEKIFRLMAGLGIDVQKTRDSLKLNTYDHHAAIYLLLLERLRTRPVPQESSVCLTNSPLNGSQIMNTNSMKYQYPTLEQQRRRPSSIAEQAMRKLGISNTYGTRGDQSPRHHTSITSNNEQPMESIPSMMTLRDTSIRERNSGYFRGSTYVGIPRERNERDCGSPYGQYNSLSASGREDSCSMSRENCFPGRTPSSRVLASGIDQRIIKQSTEDCRRLLQQATAVADPCRIQSTQPTAMELSSTPPKHTPIMPSTSPSAQLRVLTTSNSFDSKSNIPNFARFQMSAEATKLFNTLQQSPLPINPEVNSPNTSLLK